jgi:hypothetical protein
MEISYLKPSVLTGGVNVTSTSLAPGSNPMAANLNDVEASIANPGMGLDTEAGEPLPACYASQAVPAVAAPAPSMISSSGSDSTGEPVSQYATPPDGA